MGLWLDYQNNVLRVHRNDWRTTFFERKSDSKGFSYLTEEVWTTLSKPLSTCPEDYCDSVFKNFLIQVFRSGSKWFQIFGKKLGAVLSKVHSICQWNCFEVFLIKKTWNLMHNFSGFSDSIVSKELLELKVSCQKLQLRKNCNFKKKKLCKILLNLVQIIEQGCKRSNICVHRDLSGFVFFIGPESKFVRRFADNFLSK